MPEKTQNSPVLVRTKARDDISRIASEHGARNIRVFGSASRGEASAQDLDLLVEMAEDRSLFDLIALSQELEDALGVEVDVQTEAGLSPYLRDRILSEAVPL
jgi:predicted nucleotidyltransferase